MIDPVERRRQVRVQHPLPLGVCTPRDMEDGVDRVMATPARPEPVGPWLESGFPLGFQRVDHASLQHAINDDGDGAFILRSLPCGAVSYTHLRAHETVLDLVCRLLLEKKK